MSIESVTAGTRPDEIYTADFFRAHERSLEYYRIFARTVFTTLRPQSAVDFGCGNGYILDELCGLGVKRIKGFDGSPHSVEHAPSRIRPFLAVTDLSQPLADTEPYDLVISTEVAEHLPESAADAFIDNLCAHAAEWVVFTAAHPGQEGTDHINCQPKSYWRQKFETRGVHYSGLATNLILAGIGELERGPWWLKANLQVLSRSARLPRGGYWHNPARWIDWTRRRAVGKVKRIARTWRGAERPLKTQVVPLRPDDNMDGRVRWPS